MSHPPGLSQQPATWDAVAPTYAEDADLWNAFARESLRLLPLRGSDRVLDVGAGSGLLALAAAKHAKQVDAIDFSPGMVEQLRARAEREKLTNVAAEVMDAQDLAFEEDSFDAAFSLFAFFFFPNRARAFAEMYRVLKPGARALIATWGPIERRPMMRIGFEAAAEALPHLPRPRKGDLQEPADCIREMSQAGFKNVQAHTFTASIEVENAEHYLDCIVRSGAPFAVMKQKVDEATWRDMMEKMLNALKTRLPENGGELGAEAILTMGTR